MQEDPSKGEGFPINLTSCVHLGHDHTASTYWRGIHTNTPTLRANWRGTGLDE